MKHVIATFAFVLCLATAGMAQNPTNAGTNQNPTATDKPHVCTSACKNGQHMYAHGEKGHTCGKECKAMNAGKAAEGKPHVCTAACKNGQHMYAHGEKGHVCTAACKSKM